MTAPESRAERDLTLPQEPSNESTDTPAAAEPLRSYSRRVGFRWKPLKVLFFAANSPTSAPLRTDKEYNAIEQSIHDSRYRDRFQLIPKFAGTQSELEQALLWHKPDIVHFACHGTAQAEIVLVDGSTGSAPLPAEALSSLLRAMREHVTLVVLNACFAAQQAKAIRDSVGLAIGMQSRITDDTAIEFAAGLYRWLAHGRSLHDAFEAARHNITDVAAQQIPKLFKRTDLDPMHIHMIRVTSDLLKALWILCLLAMCTVLALAWRSCQREPMPPDTDMVRFEATDMYLGVFDNSLRPPECSTLDSATEDCALSIRPARAAAIHIETFDLDILEVTNKEFMSWLTDHPNDWKITRTNVIELTRPTVPLVLASERCGGALLVKNGHLLLNPDKAQWPVVCVTWHGASEYCHDKRKRLPREAEWELAAKGEEGRPFPWGSQRPMQGLVASNYRDGTDAHPRDVGTSTQDVSPDRVHDLGGNVAEWVEDERNIADTKTIRGGSWHSLPCHVLGSGCKRLPVDDYDNDVGFRCARSVTEPK